MSMFCYQCQETAKNNGCNVKGVCGKTAPVSNLQDLLIYNLKGIANLLLQAKKYNISLNENDKGLEKFIIESLFATITNANFNEQYFISKISESLKIKNKYKKKLAKHAGTEDVVIDDELSEAANWQTKDAADYHEKAANVGILTIENEDIRSLKELLMYGVKGLAAYYHHANALEYYDKDIFDFIVEALDATLNETLGADELTELVLKCGKFGVKTMALLDKANTDNYGNPEPTEVNIGVGTRQGILISGHDLKDMEELLKQTEDAKLDIYTHGEMLPAHYYPKFKKYKHFVGNYGGSWWKQADEFEKFNGPILMTTNCIVQPRDSYKDRLYTTGAAGYEGVKHIKDRPDGEMKDFSGIIEQAKKCVSPEEIERGKIVGGFAHNYVLSIADKILDAVKSGSIKTFVVMAGCDGRHASRDYYTDFAKELPKNSVILTAGCAKYRYNKLALGDIGGIPRVLDAGQCNDSYSLAVIALKLAEVLGVGVNDLPIVYNIAWYEQKAVIVLLALLYLGIKKIHLGPTLPAFISPNVAKILIEKFELSGITNAPDDLDNMLSLAMA